MPRKYTSFSEVEAGKKLFLSVCFIDEINPSLTEIEAVLILGILATYMLY